MKIGHKLILGSLILASLIWAVGFYAVSVSRKSLEESIEETSALEVDKIMEDVDGTIREAIYDWQVYASRFALQKALQASNQQFEEMPDKKSFLEQQDRQWMAAAKEDVTEFMDSLIHNETSEEIKRYLKAMETYRGYKAYGEVFVTNIYGANVAQTGKTSDYRQDDEVWWQETRENGIYISDVSYDESADVYSVDLCIRIDNDHGNMLGVIKTVYNIEGIASVLEGRHRMSHSRIVKSGEHHNLILLSGDRKIIVNADAPSERLRDGSRFLPDETVQSLQENPSHAFFHRHDEQLGEILGVCTPSKGFGEYRNLGWILVYEHRAEEIFAPVMALRKNILIMSVGITLLGVFLGLVFSVPLSRRVTRLKNATIELGQGNLEVGLEDLSKDEIGQLSSTFGSMVRSLQDVTAVCEAVSQGDFSKSVELRSDNDTLGQSINQMGATLRAVVQQANTIAGGDYTTEIRPRSDQDELGTALMEMTTTLQRTTEENERQKWLITGQAEVDKSIRGEQDTYVLSTHIINTLAGYLDASIGALYLVDGDNTLKLAGSYAYQKRKHLSNEFSFGEGLVGQAAAEKKSILITDVPDDYIAIHSGLGQARPRNILVVPFLFEKEVKGVIELGSFHEITDIHTEFLEKVTESIAIAVNSAESRRRVAELLEETQRQSEELQNQQEELRVTNEELEQQTESLKKSEESLKRQQEELETVNAELEEKTQFLEEQKQELITTRNQIEIKAEELEVASKYKSEFLSNMSHELRTPLNSLLILAKMLADNKQGNLTDDQVESAKVIQEGGTDLLTLINDILDLSKIESGKMMVHIEDVEISDLASNIDKKFGHMAQDKGLALEIQVADNLRKSIQSDKMKIEQVLKNLISNALKFTKKGRITVEIKRPEETVDLSRSGLDPRQAIALAVSDTGIGISPEKQKVIFEAFQQADGSTSRQYGGTGLGLSISRELARLLGGEIGLHSVEGQGSTFTLYLPFALKQQAEKASYVMDANDDQKESLESREIELRPEPETEYIPDDRNSIGPDDKTLLVIDDDEKFVRILYEMAHEKGFQCLLAGDGKSGLACAIDYEPDAIILDVGLPDIDGFAVMDALKDNPRTRHIPVHFISAREADRDALEKGAIGYLTKPVQEESLHSALQDLQEFVSNSIKKLLVVEDDPRQRESIVKLISDDSIKVTSVETGQEAYEQLQSDRYDCMVLDLGLPDISGFDFLNQIKSDTKISKPPIIVYSGKDLTREDEHKLQEYADSIIVKGVASPERLLDETALFLHRVEADLPKEQQRMIRVLHDKDSVLKGKKILLVDDDIRNIFALSHALKDRGLTVHIAENGKKALEFLGREPKVDAVLMDIMMPVMDGYEAMRRIRQQERFANLPILALTAKAMAGDKEKCIEAGANDYLAKPVVIDKVFSMLRVWLYA